MAASKPPLNLLETLNAIPEVASLDGSISRDSLHLERTLDAEDYAVQVAQMQIRGTSDEGLPDDLDESDLRNLPTRTVVDPGEKFDPTADYRLIGAIGSGGTGIVFQAHQRAVDREVAVKVLRSHLRRSRTARERFLAEAKVIGSLDHPNVIAVHELAADVNGQVFYSMKKIDGTAWSHVLEQRLLDDHLAILLRVADAVRYAHSRGIIHRDIKPANVMLGKYGEVLVADWGLAISYPLQVENRIRNSIGGTPAYMAPEVAGGSLDDIGTHTDVYLLGATLFEILTGYPPHDGTTLLECIENAALNRIHSTDIQSELMDVALTAMATDPMERYDSVEAFQQAIEEYQQHQESISLVRRADKHAAEAQEGQNYERFSLALSLAREAIDLWPANRRAVSMLKRVRVDFARAAAEQDDLDLALSLLEAAGEESSEIAHQIRRQRDQRAALQRREERYSALFANSPDAVLVSRMQDGTVLDANDTFLRLFEHTRAEVVGNSVAGIQLWDCPERRVEFIQQIRETGKSDNFETVLKTRSNRKIPVLVSARKVVFDGEVIVVAHTRDITLRRAAEDQLRKSQTRLREVQRLANLGTWAYDLQTGVSQWSEETCRILGLPSQSRAPELEAYFELVHPEDRQKVREAFENAVTNGSAYQLEVRHRRGDGSYGTTLTRGQPITDATGTVVELFGTLLDTTENKRIEELRSRQVQAMQSLLDISSQPLVAMQTDGLLFAASRAAADLLGRRPSCFRCQVRFHSSSGKPLDTIETPQEVEGNFYEDQVPLGPVITIRLQRCGDFLHGELVPQRAV